MASRKNEAITDEDSEVKHLLTVNMTAENKGMPSYVTQSIYRWKKPKKIVAIMIQYKQKLLKIMKQKRKYQNIEDHTSEESYQDISMLQKEEAEIIKICQAKHFSKETESVNARKRVLSTSGVHQLDLFLNKDGVFRVGGRLANENFSHELKHSFCFQMLHHITIDHQVLS